MILNNTIQHLPRASVEDIRTICDDMYLVDAMDGFRIIASRVSSHKSAPKDSLFDILSIEARSDLRIYLLSYEQKPLLLPTDLGSALINPFMFSSTRLLTVSFINGERGTELFDLALAGKIEGVELPTSKYKHNSAPRQRSRMVSEFNNVLKTTTELFSSARIYPITASNAENKLMATVLNIAEFVGCPITLTSIGSARPNDWFDEKAFCGFLISTLCLAREKSKLRKAEVRLSSCKDGATAEVRFEALEYINATRQNETAFFYDYADRNYMIFEHFSTEDSFSVKFCPSRKDWSYIELKSDQKFKWDE